MFLPFVPSSLLVLVPQGAALRGITGDVFPQKVPSLFLSPPSHGLLLCSDCYYSEKIKVVYMQIFILYTNKIPVIYVWKLQQKSLVVANEWLSGHWINLDHEPKRDRTLGPGFFVRSSCFSTWNAYEKPLTCHYSSFEFCVLVHLVPFLQSSTCVTPWGACDNSKAKPFPQK